MENNIYFIDGFLSCKVIAEEVSPAVIKEIKPAVYDGETLVTPAETEIVEPASVQAKLDIPFPIYHQTIMEGGRNHYCYLTNDLIGKDVVVFCRYANVDEEAVLKFSGYLGKEWKVVQADAKVKAQCTLTKADAYATTAKVDEADVVTKYDGADKLELAHPYLAADIKSKL